MKKWRVLLSLLFILIFITSTVAAAGYSVSYIAVKVDGSRKSVREVPVIMDGQAVHLDVPSFITNQTTFVPIRFIAERYGAKVGWDQNTKTATINNDGMQIKLTIDNPYAYIDGNKVELDRAWTPKLVTFNPGTKYADSRTMVPLRFISETLGYEVGYDESKGVPFINTVNEQEDGNANEVTEVVVEKGSTNIPKVTIKGTGKLNYSTLSLSNPTRLVIDIENAKLNIKDDIDFEGGIGKISVNKEPLDKISISQFSSNPKVVRVVLNLTEKAEYDIVSLNGGKQLTIFFVNKVKQIKEEVINGKGAIVIYNSDEAEIRTMKLTNPGRIVVDLMDSSLVGGDFFSYSYNVGFIKGVRVSQFIPDSLYKPNDRIVRVVLDVKDGVSDPKASIFADGNKIVIIPDAVDNNDNGDDEVKPSGKTIVIDAGHGGTDPGTMPNGVKEKNINLSVALKLDKALKKLGYNTILTRDKDVFVELYERADIANRNNADIFISLHSNSIGSSSISGIQVLYCPAFDSDIKTGDNYPLSDAIMKELIKGTGAVNKGIIKRPDLAVLRRTSMPAALIEMGFLTNPAEAQKLQSDSYQNTIVESIVRGIETYFKTN